MNGSFKPSFRHVHDDVERYLKSEGKTDRPRRTVVKTSETLANESRDSEELAMERNGL